MSKEYFKTLLYDSLTFRIYSGIYKLLVSAPILKYFFNPYKLTPLWNDSFIFVFFETALKRIFLALIDAAHKAVLRTVSRKDFFRNNFYEHLTGMLILIASVFAGRLSPELMFIAVVVWGGIFLGRNRESRRAVSYTAVLSLFLFFRLLYGFIFSGNGASSAELLTPFLLFITASFSLDEKSNAELITGYSLISLTILSGLVIVLPYIENVQDNIIISYSGIITVLMPLSLARTAADRTKMRRILMTVAILFLSAAAVLSSGSVKLYTAYSAALILFTALTKPKLLIYILLIFPTAVRLTLNYLINTLNSHIKYRTPAENIINISRELWNRSLSEGSEPFINAYNSFTDTALNPYASYISERHIELVNISGRILLAVFLWFVLKSIRACVITFFKSSGKSRIQSAASISFLAASSIAAFVTSNGGEFSVNLLYFLILAVVISKNRAIEQNAL